MSGENWVRSSDKEILTNKIKNRKKYITYKNLPKKGLMYNSKKGKDEYVYLGKKRFRNVDTRNILTFENASEMYKKIKI